VLILYIVIHDISRRRGLSYFPRANHHTHSCHAPHVAPSSCVYFIPPRSAWASKQNLSNVSQIYMPPYSLQVEDNFQYKTKIDDQFK